jgi:pentatricopeptide repeat protein
MAYSVNTSASRIDGKIEDNITQKINSMQFNALKEDLFNSNDSTNYHNTEVLRLVILKSIQKKNLTFAFDVFEDMTRLEIVPDDATYTALMERLLSEGDTEEAFELYIQAYLNNVILDLEIFHSLFERLQKKDISYIEVAYKILKADLIPSKFIYDHVVHIAQKHKAADLLKLVYEDMNKYGITSVDTPKNKHSRHYSSSRKRKSKQSNSMRDKSDSPVVVIPFDVSNGKSIQRGFAKGDLSINNLLEDLAYVVNQNKHKGEGLYSGDEDEEYSNSDEDSSSDLSDSDEGSSEDDTSDSDVEK